ncbi:hypothetical protein RRG08_062103 [Elysia crispata]|uniref:Uncharacterized protein n=1 Tax=Elysia crispata TaxID=231223 RepID=A0AAE1D1Y2_9GAST|nr:hypothetical protein RRG08_062103 [Elysia crispata]
MMIYAQWIVTAVTMEKNIKFHAANTVLETTQRATMSMVIIIWDVIRATKVHNVFKNVVLAIMGRAVQKSAAYTVLE